MTKTTPYTYLIGWSQLNTWYYGRRTKKNCQPSDLWESYFTSSKYVKQFRTDHGEPDVIMVRKTFDNPSDCIRWESKVLRRIDAQHNKNYLNRKNGDEKWYNDHPHTEETKRKISGTNKIKLLGNKNALGMKHTDSWKEQQRLRRLGGPGPNLGRKFTEEWVEKMSLANKGRVFTEDHKLKLQSSAKNRSKPIVDCPHCSKSGWIVNMKRYHFDNCKNKR